MRLRMIFGFTLATIALSGCTTTQNAGAPDTAASGESTTQASRLMKLAADVEAQGDPDTALALYERAAAAPDARALAFVEVGDAYMRSGYSEEAVKAYRAALSKSPKDGQALIGLGSAMALSGDEAAGLRALAEGAQIVNTSKAYNKLGVAQTLAGETEAAQGSFSRGLALSPGDLDIETNMALAAALAGNGPVALPLVRKVAASPKAQLRHKRNIVVVYGLLGQADQIRAAPPTGLSTKEINSLLDHTRTIRAKSSTKARAKALGSMNIQA